MTLDRPVMRLFQMQIEDMFSLVTLRREETGQGGRKLVINQKSHEA